MSVIPRSNELNAGRQGEGIAGCVCGVGERRSEAKKLRLWGANRGYHKFNMLTSRGDRIVNLGYPDEKRNS